MNTEYLTNELETSNGNGHHNGNGNGKSPQQKAWDTARTQGAEKERTEFIKGRDEELRALMDKALPHGAVRLFCLLFKLSWMPECGGFYKGMKGVIAIAGKKLARMARANPKSFYRSEKNGKVSPGWIDLLIAGGYIWITKHKIPNIQENKWLNVYHISVLDRPVHQQSLPWADGNWGGEVVLDDGPEGATTENGSGENSASKTSTTEETPKNGLAHYRNPRLPTTENGSGPLPATPVGHYRKGHLASGGNGSGPIPATPLVKGGKRGLASGGNGSGPKVLPVLNRKTGVGSDPSESNNGGTPADLSAAQEKELRAWLAKKNLPEMFDSKRVKLEGDLRADLLALRADPRNHEREMTSQAREDYDFAQAKVDELIPTNPKEAKTWEKRRNDIATDAKSWRPGALRQHAAGEERLLLAKIKAVKEAAK
jgi:hypothetical protein